MAGPEGAPDSELPGQARDSTSGGEPAKGAGEVAELYLGNILYALERCAMSFDAEEAPEHAAFYRGIARKLAVAHGRASKSE